MDQKKTLLLAEKIGNQIKDGDIILPVLPDIVVKVFDVTTNPNSSAKDLAKLIMSDQTLAVKIIEVSNSSYYAGVDEMTSLPFAVARLGFKTISNIIFSIAMNSQFKLPAIFSDLEYRHREHSLLVAFIARDLAMKVRLDGDEAYLTGLLHDVGKPIILTMINDASKKNPETPIPQLESVEKILSKFHAYAGFIAAKKWNMSERVQRSIYFHHRFDFAKENRDMAALIQLSNNMAHHSNKESIEKPFVSKIMKDIKITSEDVKEIIKSVESYKETISSLTASSF